MSEVSNYYLNSEFALAAYADLASGVDPIPALTSNSVGMSPVHAAEFATNWRVVDQYTDASNGISATVFESVATGERYLAVRGTQDVLDIWTDFIDIALLGTPERQAQYASLRDQVRTWLSRGTLTPGFSVAGHSLGGFLAGALLVDYPAEINHAYLYNAPGVGGVAAGLRLLANLETEPTLSLTKVSNLIAQVGPSVTAGLGLDWGTPIPVAIENQSPNILDNHSILHLTDALAVQSLLSELSSAADIKCIGDILYASTSQSEWALESVVNAVGDLFQAGAAIIGTESDPRNMLYTRILAIQAGASYQAAVQSSDFTEIVSLSSLSSNQLAELARSDIAYRYALEHLLPFAISVADAALYAPHNINGELDLASHTDRYWDDRADFLTWKLRVNTQDLPDDVAYFYGDDECYYYDASNGAQVWVGNPLDVKGDPLNLRQILFGGRAGDVLSGGNNSDRIYGGTGDDQLSGGNDGFDYLEGGSGDDRLEGGRRADTLVGGAGSDTYVYVTGDGTDTVIDSDGRGSIVFDGAVLTGGYALGPGSQDYLSDDGQCRYRLVKNGAFTDLWINDVILVKNFAVGDLGLTLESAPPAMQENTIRFIEGDHAPVDFGDGAVRHDELGNVITDYASNEPRSDVLYGSVGNDRLLGWMEQDRIDGRAGNDVIEGGDEIDVVVGGEGDDDIYGGDRTDISTLSGYEGFGGESGTDAKGDWLVGGPGDDRILSGNDDDVIEGGSGNDLIISGAGNDIINGDGYYVTSIFDWSVSGDDNPFDKVWNNKIDGDFNADEGFSDIVYAGAGDDWVAGFLGNDLIYGEIGRDTLSGDDGDDALYGGAGDDVITGDYGDYAYSSDGTPIEQGNDYLSGGSGDDWMQGEGGDDALVGDEGNDTLYGDAPYLGWGYHGDDYLDGGEGSDLLFGQYGDDILIGGGGDDSGPHAGLVGGAGDDLLYGGLGDDYLYGDDEADAASVHGNDMLYGEDGNDRLMGHAGDDTLEGGAGDDVLHGGDGNDTLVGGAGLDVLSGGYGADTLDGGPGADTIYADDDDVVILRKGDGSDEVVFSGQAGMLLLEGVSGSDISVSQLDNVDGGQHLRLSYGESSVVIYDGFLGGFRNYSLTDSSLDQQALMTHSSAVNLVGSIGEDTLYGSNDGDILRGFVPGLAGSDSGDSLYGQGGDDLLEAGDGNDRLDGGTGMDTLIGNAGDDIYVVDRVGDLVLENTGQGTDTVEATIDYIVPDNVENIALLGDAMIGATGNALVNRMFGNSAPNVLAGLQGDDVLLGRGGDDVLVGGDGADRLFGEDGNDRLEGGVQDDTLYGGAGDDVFVATLGSGADVVLDIEGANCIEFGAGITRDSLNATQYQGDDGGYYLRITYGPFGDAIAIKHGLTGVIQTYCFEDGSSVTHEELVGQATIPILVEGTGRDEAISGGSQGDRIQGGAGDDQLYGAAGDDTLLGGWGSDTLNGESDDDMLDGGAGDDILIGGAGEDRYVMQWGMGSDLIMEDGAELSTLELGAGLQLADLEILRDQEDLVIRFAGGEQGVRIQGYGVAPDSWRLEDGAGNRYVLNDLIAGPTSSATPPGFDAVSASFLRRVRSNFINTLTSIDAATGYAMGADGILRKTASYVSPGYVGTSYYTARLQVEETDTNSASYTQTTQAFTFPSSYSVSSILESNFTPLMGGSGEISDTYGAGSRRYYSLTDDAGIEIPQGAALVLVYGTGQDQGADQSLQLDGYNGIVDPPQPIGLWVFERGSETTIATTATHRISTHDAILNVANVTGGEGDNQITVQGHAVVDGGGGNDRLIAADRRWDSSFGNNFVPSRYTYTGTFDDRNMGALLFGNDGSDQLVGGGANDVLIGGAGGDYLDGRLGEDTYVVRRGEGGYDLIADSGMFIRIDGEWLGSRYLDWYYHSVGMPDVPESLLSGAVLPSDMSPLPALSPNDFPAMAQLALDGVVEMDTVEFSSDIALGQLMFSWGEVILESPVALNGDSWYSSPWMSGLGTSFTTLDISWQVGEGVRIVIPHTYVPDPMALPPAAPGADSGGDAVLDRYALFDPYGRSDEYLGLGIEQFRFADGSVLSMSDMLALAPPPPTFDPHRDTLSLAGTEARNLLVGTRGTDQLKGLGGDDTLYGGEDTDRLDGGSGADMLFGGGGGDAYVIDDPGDRVMEFAGEGVDTVFSFIDYTLPDEVERLYLLKSAITGTGNALQNDIAGNGMANRLTGLEGNDFLRGMVGDDILDGGAGDDILLGGGGNDRYRFARGGGQDRIRDYDYRDARPEIYGPTSDVVALDADVDHDQLWFSRVGNDLKVGIIGTDDHIEVEDWYFGDVFHVEEFRAGDGYGLQHDQVEQLVQAMAAFAPPASGEFDLPDAYRAELAPVIAANWQAA